MDPLAVAGAITAILAALGGVGHLVLIVYRWARRMEKALTYVESEMKLNGGKTMRDSVARLESVVAEIADHLGTTPRRNP